MKRIIIMFLGATALAAAGAPATTFTIKPGSGDMTRVIQRVIDKAVAEGVKGKEVTVRLLPGTYNLSRKAATPVLYHISNTTSVDENADPVKHVGILMKGASNLTIDGEGARLVTHGEMTPWVIDQSDNVTLKGFTVVAADPSVPEMTVTSTDVRSFKASVHPSSAYRVSPEGKLFWTGDGWEFTDGIAQVYDPVAITTLRCGSPVVDASMVSEIEPGVLQFDYASDLPASIREGVTFQMRHSFRTEVAGFINRSKNVVLDGLALHFMGNFGIVAQYTENVTYSNLVCAPEEGSGRTCAGFADFLQVSGCRGLVKIDGCRFAGAHDDPINVHGTHLRVVDQPAEDRLVVRFMHPQTFGFEAFVAGDTCALVNDVSLIAEGPALVVKEARMMSDYDMELTFTTPVRVPGDAAYVLENITWTPAVEITENYFTLTPTRGILVTTCRPVTIARNNFVNIPMASILVADDARSWYESGPVRNLVIKDNLFNNCSAPQIWIAPENRVNFRHAKVHSGVVIENNHFTGAHPALVKARSLDGLTMKGNYVSGELPTRVDLDNCSNVSIDNF